MPLYTVLAPPARAGESSPDPVGFVFVKEGFIWPALFLPELWMLFRRMWIVLALYVAVGLALTWLASRYGGPLPWIALAFVHLLFALEASQLRRLNLARRGYSLVGVVEGRRNEVEERFFAGWQPPMATPAEPPAATPAGETRASVPSVAGAPSAEAGEVVGLFPAPGGRS